LAATIRASTRGLEIVDIARRKKGWAKSEPAWADLAFTSIPTLKRFFAGVAIQADAFQAICAAVGIDDWESIADLETTNELMRHPSGRRISFAIVGSVENMDKLKLDSIVALLQKIGGDVTIEILESDEA
jgi:hypothetical protein